MAVRRTQEYFLPCKFRAGLVVIFPAIILISGSFAKAPLGE